MSSFDSYSLYNNTSDDGEYRDYYEELALEKDSTDYFIYITKEYRHKPGKLAYDIYGSERLSWVFAYFNRDKIDDMIFDLVEGLILRVPTKDRLLSAL